MPAQWGVISSILTDVHGYIFANGCGGAEALAGRDHVSFLCSDGIRVVFGHASCSGARPSSEITRMDDSKPGRLDGKSRYGVKI